MATEKQIEANRENAKLGGRPISEATIRAQMARDYISEQVKKSLEPIVAKAINDAILGNDSARSWLSDRAWGKSKQEIGLTDTEGNDLLEPSEKIKELAAALNGIQTK